MSLLNQLREVVTSKRLSALDEYRQIVARADEPHKGDVERIGALLPVLGITPDDVAKDVEAFKTVSRLQPLASSVTQRIQQRQQLERDKTAFHETHNCEMQLAKEAYEKECWARSAQLDRALEDEKQSQKAATELPKIMASNPRLFENR